LLESKVDKLSQLIRVLVSFHLTSCKKIVSDCRSQLGTSNGELDDIDHILHAMINLMMGYVSVLLPCDLFCFATPKYVPAFIKPLGTQKESRGGSNTRRPVYYFIFLIFIMIF